MGYVLLLLLGIVIVAPLLNGGLTNKEEDCNKKFQELEYHNGEVYILLRQMHDVGKRWEIANSLADDLKHVFGEDWRGLLAEHEYQGRWDVDCIDPYVGCNIYWGAVVNLYYARKGKLVTSVGRRNYRLVGLYQNEETYAINTFRLIEQYIQKKHPDYQLLFVPWHDYDCNRKRTVIFHDVFHVGRFAWNFDIERDEFTKKRSKRMW